MPPALERGILPQGPLEMPFGGIGGGTATGEPLVPLSTDAATAFLPQTESGEALKNRKVALVTGGTRGIGAEISRALAQQGYTIVAPHRDPDKQTRRADPLVKEIETIGGEMYAPPVDLTDYDSTTEFIQEVGDRYGHVDLLITNHAGGAEEWATDEYSYQVNADSKVDLTFLAASLDNLEASEDPSRKGKARKLTVIDIPSLWSLEYGIIDQLPEYDRIAKGKNAGMLGLEEVVDMLNKDPKNDVDLLYLCGHGIGDTFIMRGYRRNYPDLMARIEATARNGKFPVMKDMAKAAAKIATGDFPDRHVEFVGIPHWNKDHTHQEMGQVYGPKAERITDIIFFGDEAFAKYVPPADYQRDPFTKENGEMRLVASDLVTKEGKASRAYALDVNEKHTEDHMKDRGVFKGVYVVEAGKQASQAFLHDRLGLGADQGLRLKAVDEASFALPILHENITIEVTETDNPLVTTTVVRKQNGDVASTIGALEFEIVPIDQVDRGFSETDSVEWAAQAGGAVFLKNKYYPEVTPEGVEPIDTAVTKEIDVLPLFSGWESVMFENVVVDPANGFVTHAKVGEQNRKGFVEDAKIYQGDALIATVRGADCKLMSKNAFNRVLDHSEPK